MPKIYFYFPLSVSVRSGDVGSLILSMVIYVVACAVLGVLQMVLGWIPIVGVLLKMAFGLLGLYCVAGMVLSVLKFFQH